MIFRTALDAAIMDLIIRSKVESSADVAEKMNYKSRGTISDYASGKKLISSGFRTEFESKFGINLIHYEEFIGKSPMDLVLKMYGPNKKKKSGPIEPDYLPQLRKQINTALVSLQEAVKIMPERVKEEKKRSNQMANAENQKSTISPKSGGPKVDSGIIHNTRKTK